MIDQKKLNRIQELAKELTELEVPFVLIVNNRQMSTYHSYSDIQPCEAFKMLNDWLELNFSDTSEEIPN